MDCRNATHFGLEQPSCRAKPTNHCGKPMRPVRFPTFIAFTVLVMDWNHGKSGFEKLLMDYLLLTSRTNPTQPNTQSWQMRTYWLRDYDYNNYAKKAPEWCTAKLFIHINASVSLYTLLANMPHRLPIRFRSGMHTSEYYTFIAFKKRWL